MRPCNNESSADGATKIVNFGTAGLVCAKELKGLLKVTHIKERDMQAENRSSEV